MTNSLVAIYSFRLVHRVLVYILRNNIFLVNVTL